MQVSKYVHVQLISPDTGIAANFFFPIITINSLKKITGNTLKSLFTIRRFFVVSTPLNCPG